MRFRWSAGTAVTLVVATGAASLFLAAIVSHLPEHQTEVGQAVCSRWALSHAALSSESLRLNAALASAGY